ncbi:MAG TPA: hypothetical protein VK154_03295 [Chitinophagales bacterium]|nr:hypothetical protein [Chitinophagales bacterium]
MKDNSLLKSIREYENMHIALWLVKDSCWVASVDFPWLKIPGMIMIVPTLIAAIFITWRARHDQADLFHNIAVCLWISANASWMIGEFYFEDKTRHIAMAFFAAGLVVVAIYYIVHFPKRMKENSEAAS